MNEIDSIKNTTDLHDIKALKKRLYNHPGYKTMTPYEKELDRTLRSHMIHNVKPLLKTANATTALYDYIHDADLYKRYTAYAYKKSGRKPRGFDLCQKVLHDAKFNRGAPRDMVLYRAISKREIAGSFVDYNVDGEYDDEFDDSLWYVNRNVSTAVSPMASLNFLDKKEPGIKCCMLIFKIPKGYPCIYMPGLFSTKLTEDEREVFLPSGEYVVETAGFTIYVDPKKIGMQKKMGTRAFHMKVMVLKPLQRFSEFVTTPRSLSASIPYKRRQRYMHLLFDKTSPAEKAKRIAAIKASFEDYEEECTRRMKKSPAQRAKERKDLEAYWAAMA